MKTERICRIACFGLLIAGLLLAGQAYSVSAEITPPSLINGYSGSVSGEVIPYFSIYPKYAREALLTRCTDGKKSIEWMTAPVPGDFHEEYCYFNWIAAHSSGTSSGERFFDLYINDEFVLTFLTKAKAYPATEVFYATDSTRFEFEFKTKDGAGDSHGLVYLRVPAKRCVPGKPLKLRITGHAQQSNDWYMTFRYSFCEKVEVASMPFLLRSSAGKESPLRIVALHFGTDTTLAVKIDDKQKGMYTVHRGFNVFELPIAAVQQETPLRIHAEIGTVYSMDTTLIIRPVRYRELDLVHHSHTDIGYSHIQEEVIRIHNDNIREALKEIKRTIGYPEGARFVWNIESAWAVENFMQAATADEKKAFLSAVNNHQIEISATYANIMTGLSTPEEMDWITSYSQALNDSFGTRMSTAMLTDVPGMSWSMVKALADKGVRYFSNGPNYIPGMPGGGDRIGHTLSELGDKVYWWKSPGGKDSILLWTCGRGYSSWHGTADGAVVDRGPEKIADYLNELEDKKYPYDLVQWRYNIVSDNGPVDHSIADFVKQWNETYTSPRLVLANVHDVFQRFEKRYGKKIPTLTGDFTPYWEDGAYSTAREEGDCRLLSQRLVALEKLARLQKINLPESLCYQAQRDVLLFHEHTWGSWNSISEPDLEFTRHQWEYKQNYLLDARRHIDSLDAILSEKLTVADRITVYNPSAAISSRYVEVDGARIKNGNAMKDDKGKLMPLQQLQNGRYAFLAKDIPARGAMHYSPVAVDGQLATLFPERFKYSIDSKTGVISSLIVNNREWIDSATFHGLTAALYVKGLDPAKFMTTSRPRMQWVDRGEVVNRVRVICDLQGSKRLVYEITQVNGLDELFLSVITDKQPVREKESMHIAFPFALRDRKVRIGIGDTYYQPGRGQLKAANKDFFSLQRWIDVSDSSRGVTICSLQGALFEKGEMVNEVKDNNGYKQWRDEPALGSTLFCYALNNYWHTNFKADQEGEVRFDFVLKFHGPFKLKEAHEFGEQWSMPVMVY